MYTRGNPLKYTDPSGHCAVLEDGSRNGSDQECWDLADSIYNGWDGDADYWNQRFGSKDIFMNQIAVTTALDKNFMQWQLDQYWIPFYQRTGAHHARYNPAPQWNEGQNPELRMPGDTIVKAAVVDTVQCANDFPLGCGKLASDVSLTAAAGAVVLCAGVTGGGCLAVGGSISTVAGGIGAAITTRNAIVGEGNATAVDVIVAWGTTAGGGFFGDKLVGVVGATFALGQRLYDEWSSDR